MKIILEWKVGDKGGAWIVIVVRAHRIWKWSRDSHGSFFFSDQNARR